MEDRTIKYDDLLNIVRGMNKDELFCFFLRACENENLQVCQLCLDAGADINMRYHEDSLLECLVFNRTLTIKVADWLIEKGANMDTGIKDNTLFTKACMNGNYNIAKYFFNKGVKVNEYKSHCESDLDWAVYGGNIEIVKFILDLGVDIEAFNYEPNNPFISALKKKRADIVELFLQKGVSPDIYIGGNTFLHEAVANNDINSARVLLKYNAQVNAKLKAPCYMIKKYLAINSMDIAVFNKNEDMQKLLLEFGGIVSNKDERIEVLLGYCNDNEFAMLMKKMLIE